MTVRGRATRARLIEATVSVVREVGYAHASTRAIAQAAGVAEGTIYRHFPDKASLFFATVLESNVPIVAWVTTLPARAGEGTVEENLTDAAVRLAGLRDQILPACDVALHDHVQRILEQCPDLRAHGRPEKRQRRQQENDQRQHGTQDGRLAAVPEQGCQGEFEQRRLAPERPGQWISWRGGRAADFTPSLSQPAHRPWKRRTVSGRAR